MLTWQQKLRSALGGGLGVRLGEAAVVSRRVHMSPSHRPELVYITAVDAGQAFYHRRRSGEILHLDLSHAVGELDHRLVAAAVREVWQGVPALHPVTGARLGDLVEFADIQTGTGGGCVVGTLTYGRRLGLLNSHRNHIHLTALLAESQVEWLLPLVAALERVCHQVRLEPRRIHTLEALPPGGGPTDLSDYADHFDSRLKGSGAPGNSSLRPGRAMPAPESTPGGSPGTAPPASRGGWAGWAGEATPGGGTAPTGEGETAPEDLPTAMDPWRALRHEQDLQVALNMARRFGSPEEIRRLLELVVQPGNQQPSYLMKLLEDEDLITRDGRQTVLTAKGQALAQYLNAHFRELKLRFRKQIRRLPGRPQMTGHDGSERLSSRVRYGPVRRAEPVPPGEAVGDLAVPETVVAALRRIRGAGEAAATPQRSPALHFVRPDLHQHLRSGRQALNICLLIDASASMAGRRILAAKYLARHLLLSTRDRIAVIAFQERDVRGYVPFTRDWSHLEAGLARVQPMGLTPLAHGLEQSLTLIKQSRVRRPLLLLVTDGIPTVPRWTIDPLADALQAAKWVRQAHIPFACIGLQPSRRYLQELAKVAGGTLTVVDELHEEALVGFAHQQRAKHLIR